MKLRRFWFQFHKWIGILLAILLVPLSLTGAALVWDEELEPILYPQRFAVSSPAGVLPPSAYVAAARGALKPADRLSRLTFGEAGDPVILSAVRPPANGGKAARPVRVSVWMDPATAKVLDVAASNAGILRVFHDIHGSLMIPGAGRQIVGWLGVAMFISCISGIWLWWPTAGKWTRGLRWKRARDFDTNLHHMAGFWIAIPLAMLCFTGAWISFPAFFGQFSGSSGPSMADRMAMMRALPLARPKHGLDEITALAEQKTERGTLKAIEWPTDRPAPWRISLGNKRSEIYAVDDETGAIARDNGRGNMQPGGIARTMRRWHDGTGMGLVWRIVITAGGIVPAILGVTGILMWLRSRKWRGAIAAKQKRAHATA